MATVVDTRFLDPARPVAERVQILVGQMTLREKIAQLLHTAPPIPRLHVPAYTWWNECLHGVGRAGRATVFPQGVGMAATFNAPLVHRIATAISDEARAKYLDAQRRGNTGMYAGLTFWSPNINLFRDPRWGRGQETYGEDPYLTARLGVAFVKGLQGDDPRHLKTVATPKHFAVHSGPEAGRHGFNAVISGRDLRESYLPAFQAAVTEGGAESVMTAYNRTNGEACSASPTLLGRILRGEWGFRGYVVSDCGAVEDIYHHHQLAPDLPAAAALAVRAGCDLCCGEIYRNLLAAHQQGLVSEEEIATSVRRLFTARFRLGMFDPPEQVRWNAVPAATVCCPAHRQLALDAARESLVLLKNDGVLPLKPGLSRIGVAGPLALDLVALLGNYNGHSPEMTTILGGLAGCVGNGVTLTHGKGCEVTGGGPVPKGGQRWLFADCDVIVACLGYTAELEGEEGDAFNADGAGGDRAKLGLPGRQPELLEELLALGKPVVVVLCTGSPVTLGAAGDRVNAILCAWYPGEAGGRAIAEALLGQVNPGGRLPITFPKRLEDVPPFQQYAMAGRTYRYAAAEPLYRFGFGLSYTTFAYSGLRLDRAALGADGEVTVRVTLANTGAVAGDEVAQLYLQPLAPSVPAPRWHLEGFQRVHLAPGERRELAFTVTAGQFRHYTDDGRPFLDPGPYRLHVGGGQPDDPQAGGRHADLTVG
ncbi:MAG: glycoside hydrolase family 3 N-terminal domain-containing protein [Lentisphaeria bacterium]